jgi:ABC-type glycerol-3-phosphate transport system substrate-binding protein
MKKLLKIASILTLGLFFTACGGSDSSASEGFSKSGKAGSLDITYSSPKPLVTVNNSISVKVIDHGKVVKGAKVEFKVFMPEMPGMPYMENIQKMNANGDIYNGNVNFSMGGTWQVKIFIEKDGKKYKYSSSVIL